MNWTTVRSPLVNVIFAVSALVLSGRGAGAHDMEMKSWSAGNTQPSQKVYWLHGRVNDANEPNGLVNITHDPVKELAWPSMTMTFHVSDKTLFARMHPHDSIDFALKEVSGNHYEVVDVKERK